MKQLFYILPVLVSILFISTSASAQDSTGFHSLGLLHLPDQAWDVTVQGIYGYVACDDSGLCIVNISNAHSPTLVSHLALNGWAQGIVVQNERAYVACRFGGVAVVNISNPNAPTLVMTYEPVPMNVRGVFLLDSVLYAISDNYGLYTFSISNPDTLRFLGSIGLTNGYRVQVIDTLAYVANGGAGFAIVNVSNPTNMTIVGTFPRLGCSFRNLTVFGQCAYCASYTGSNPGTWGIYAIDISNPTNPVLIALDSLDASTSSQNGPFGISVIGERLISSYYGILKVFDISNTDTMRMVSTYVTHIGIAWNLAVVDTMVYVADDTIGLHEMSYSQPTEYANTGIELPARLSLIQNYPNPFNPTTTIRYSITTPGMVDLHVFDVTGRELAMLAHERKNAGSYSIVFDASKLPSGIYFYRLQTNRFTAIKKMVLVK